jgi:hypothetical protein
MNKLCILNSFNKSNYCSKPYPHLEIYNTFDDDVYSKLKKDYDLFIEFFKKKKEFEHNNIRIQINAKELLESNLFKKSIWYDFTKYHTSLDFFKKIIDIFYNDIVKFYPKISGLLYDSKDNSNFLGIRNIGKLNDYNFVADCQPGINTPCFEKSSVRGPHVDNPAELIAGLFYLRDDLDKSTGGDLVIHSSGEKKIYFEGKAEVKNIQDLTDVKIIKYKKNHTVFFLNSINSIHSITPRQVTNNTRCLTNIIIETYKIEKNLFILNRNQSVLKILNNKLKNLFNSKK